jgi:hypothetical protein
MNKTFITILKTGAASLLAFSLFLLLPAISTAEAGQTNENREILAIGSSSITGGNLARAKKRAISSALMKGAELYLLNLLGSQGMVQNFERVLEEIIPNAREGIENFNILAENRTDQKYTVLLKLKVNQEMIAGRLKKSGITPGEEPPDAVNLLFMVLETLGEVESHWWKDVDAYAVMSPTELALTRAFQERGFDPINRTSIPPEATFSSPASGSKPSLADALAWGKLLSADVVIFGNSRISEDGDIYVNLEAADVAGGVLICKETRFQETKLDLGDTEKIFEALQKIAVSLTSPFYACIVQGMEVQKGESDHFEMTLAGLRNFKQFMTFKDFLINAVPGITSAIPSRIQGDSVTISIQYKGGKEKFLGDILNHPKLPFPIHLSRSEEGNTILNLE